MKKRSEKIAIAIFVFLFVAVLLESSVNYVSAASYRTPNFIVEASDPQTAMQIANTAESLRKSLAILWLGHDFPDWSQPCVITVHVGPHLGAGGSTTFYYDRGEVTGWRMSIQGSYERIMDSVLPHEITHMIFASEFRQALPRWADEGGATSVEHSSEIEKHRRMLQDFLRSGRGIAFSDMFRMTEYPNDVMPLYAQGFTLTDFLINQGGRKKFVEFLREGMRTGDWPAAVKNHYGYADLGALQNAWLAWVANNYPPLQPQPPTPNPNQPENCEEQLVPVRPNKDCNEDVKNKIRNWFKQPAEKIVCGTWFEENDQRKINSRAHCGECPQGMKCVFTDPKTGNKKIVDASIESSGGGFCEKEKKSDCPVLNCPEESPMDKCIKNYIFSASVRIKIIKEGEGRLGTCSGTIIDSKNGNAYVLTAGHCFGGCYEGNTGTFNNKCIILIDLFNPCIKDIPAKFEGTIYTGSELLEDDAALISFQIPNGAKVNTISVSDKPVNIQKNQKLYSSGCNSKQDCSIDSRKIVEESNGNLYLEGLKCLGNSGGGLFSVSGNRLSLIGTLSGVIHIPEFRTQFKGLAALQKLLNKLGLSPKGEKEIDCSGAK